VWPSARLESRQGQLGRSGTRPLVPPRFKQRAMRAGMADFIPKPVDRERLLSTIRDQLQLRHRLTQMSAVEDDLNEAPRQMH